MDFNTERENNIIKNIAKEIVFECGQRGVEVSQELANYVVKLILLNPENGFSASEVMPRSLTQQLVLMVIQELTQDTPAMNCIRMQVYWDSVKLNVAELKKEYLSTMADKAEPYLSEILSLEKEDLKKLPKLLASYIVIYQNLGSVNNPNNLKETMAAVHSVFKRKEMVDFLPQTEEQKIETIKILAQKTTAIRLYLKFCGRGGDGIGDGRDGAYGHPMGVGSCFPQPLGRQAGSQGYGRCTEECTFCIGGQFSNGVILPLN